MSSFEMNEDNERSEEELCAAFELLEVYLYFRFLLVYYQKFRLQLKNFMTFEIITLNITI